MPNLLPPGSAHPPALQLIEWIADPLSYMESNFRDYGDLFTARWQSFVPFVFVNHPEYVQQVLGADPRQFDSGMGATILKPIVGEYSLLLLDGEAHQRQRKLLMPPFHGDRLRTYSEKVTEIADAVLGAYQGAKVRVRAVMQKISLGIILRVVFGLETGERYTQLEQLLTEMTDAVASPWRASAIFLPWLQQNWTAWGQFVRRRTAIDRLIFAQIDERRKQGLGADILSLMLSAKDEEGNPMTDKEIRDQLLTLLLAGHETTASALSWCLYFIDRDPSIKQRLLNEIKQWDGNTETIGKLNYLHAVCQESLRLYPIAILTEPRIPRHDFTLGDYTFTAGTPLVPCIYLLHQREDIYKEAKRFNPDRFLERQFSPYEYIPFGGGGRRCIGAAFAMMEMKMVLLSLLCQFDYRILPDRLGRPIKPTRRGVTVAPSPYLTMKMTRKKLGSCISQL